MKHVVRTTRRAAILSAGAASATLMLGNNTAQAAELTAADPPPQTTDIRKQIFGRVWNTPFIDTHEHLCDEHDRLPPDGNARGADDWSVVLAGYLGSDLMSAGMPGDAMGRFQSPGIAPAEKWKLIEPFWPAVKNTGYGQAARISLRELYGVPDLSGETAERIQAGYESLRKPGFYQRILGDLSQIESCQVNYLRGPFLESKTPTLMMQDLSIVGMFAGPDLGTFGRPSGIDVKNLDDWHRVMDWWFNKYGSYAVAVKSQDAYRRDIDYATVPAEQVVDTFRKRVEGEPVSPEEQKALEDHLFWQAVRRATENQLPIKLHTGYYAGQNGMPLSRLINNAGSACELCRRSPESTFVFMHICYPYYEELLSVAKHWTNAVVDMCWSWIINPLAAKDFLKKFLVSAPANKVLTFGGDYLFVEQVLGHALIARHGIALALSELVEEGWLGMDDAQDLIDPIMHGNARRLFRLAEKEQTLRNAPWS